MSSPKAQNASSPRTRHSRSAESASGSTDDPGIEGEGDGTAKRKRGRPTKAAPVSIDNIQPEIVTPTVIIYDERTGDCYHAAQGKQSKKLIIQQETGKGGQGSPFLKQKNTSVRISRRLAKKRESGYVAPWKSLMSGVREESGESDNEEEISSPQKATVKASNFILTPKPSPTGRKRGRPRKNKVTVNPNEDGEEEQGVNDNCLSEVPQEIKALQTAIDEQEVKLKQEVDEEEQNICEHAAVKINKQIPGRPDQVQEIMETIATASKITGFEVTDSGIYVYGSLETLIKAKELITEACQDPYGKNLLRPVQESEKEQVTEPSEVTANDETVEVTRDSEAPPEPAPADEAEASPTIMEINEIDLYHKETTKVPNPEQSTKDPNPEESTIDPNPEESTIDPNPEGSSKDTNHKETSKEPDPGETTKDPNPEETTEYTEDALNTQEGEEEPATDVADDEGDVEGTVMINPTTGRRYTRLCAVYKNPERANVVCNLCNFVTTARGLMKHKVRHHPDTLFECEICLQKFGVRYDMRRHRLSHFEASGTIKASFEPFFRKQYPDVTGPVTLALLEPDFVPPEQSGSEEAAMESLKVEEDKNEDQEAEGVNSVGGNDDEDCTEKGAEGGENDAPKTDPEKSEPKPIMKTPKMKIKNTEEYRMLKKMLHEGLDDKIKLTDDQLKTLSMAHMCQYCDFTGFRALVERHKFTNHPDFLYHCVSCPMQIGDFIDMVKHYGKHHNVTSSYVDKPTLRRALECTCCQCGHVDNEVNIKRHIIQDHDSPYNCRHCQKKFPDNKELQTHFRFAHKALYKLPDNETIQKVKRLEGRSYKEKVKRGKSKEPVLKLPRDSGRQTCETCGASVRLSWYHQHLKTHKKEILRCDLCTFTTDKPFQLKSHKLTKHGPKQFMCDVCGQTFAFKSTHKTHMVSKHSRDPPKYECEYCHKMFNVKRFLQTHVRRMHLKEKRYFCDVCNRGFFEKIRMESHREVHLPQHAKEALKQYQCKYCLVKFRDPTRLAQHENTHTGNTPFKCKHCDKSFKWSSEVSKHMTTQHNEDRRFQCTMCHKAFKFRYKLNSHMIIHTQERKHFCEVCNKVFTSLATLKKHRCRLLSLAEAQGADGEKLFVQMAQATTPEAFAMERPGTAVISSEELAQYQTGGAADANVTFMCGICHKLFSNAQDINEHVFHAHEEACEEDNNSAALPGPNTERQLVEADQNLEVHDARGGGSQQAESVIGNEASVIQAYEEGLPQGAAIGNDASDMTVQVIDFDEEGKNIQVIHIEDGDATMGQIITDEDGNPITEQVIINGELHHVIHRQVTEEELTENQIVEETVQTEVQQPLQIHVKEADMISSALRVNNKQTLVKEKQTENQVYIQSQGPAVVKANIGGGGGDGYHIQAEGLVGENGPVDNIPVTQNIVVDGGGDMENGDNIQVIQIIQESVDGEDTVHELLEEEQEGGGEAMEEGETVLIVQEAEDGTTQLVRYSNAPQ